MPQTRTGDGVFHSEGWVEFVCVFMDNNILIRPVMPAAVMVWPRLDFTEPRAQVTGFSGVLPINLGGSLDFNGVSQQCTRAVGLKIGDGFGIDTGFCPVRIA